MKTRYRETAYYCSDRYIDLQIYPEYAYQKTQQRKKRFKPTTAIQQRLNEKNKQRKVERTLEINFTEQDVLLHLTYDNNNIPADLAAAEKEVDNYLRRLKRKAQREQLGELKYLWVTEQGSRSGRIHHHLVISGLFSVQEFERIWGKGVTQVSALRCTEEGLGGLSAYILKKPQSSGKASYHSSRNLIKPEQVKKSRAGRLSRRSIEFMHSYTDMTTLEKLYPEYKIVSITPFYNDVNGGYYFDVKLYKPPRAKPDLRKTSKKEM